MANLDIIFIRVEAPDGTWGTASLANLNSQQFDEWAGARAPLPGGRKGLPWSMEQRSEFVDWLREHGGVVGDINAVEAVS